MLGGSLASMMLAALAALAGKALMTSMLALMMAALAAMKGGGGGGGGGEHKTYEVITKPIVSHVNTHSSEVQHEHGGHHHYGRSLDQGVVSDVVEAGPYAVYALERQRMMRSGNLEDSHKVSREEEQKSPNTKEIGEEKRLESSEVHAAEVQRIKRSLSKVNEVLTKKSTSFSRDQQRKAKSADEVSDQEKSSSEIHNTYSELSEKVKNTANTRKESQEHFSQRNKRNIEGFTKRTNVNNEDNFYNSHQIERREVVQRRNSAVVNENPTKKNYGTKIYFPGKLEEYQRDKRDVSSHETNKIVPVERNLNYYKPPFKYIPNNLNSRIKRNIESSRLSDSRMYHFYQNPYEYISNKLPLTDQFSMDNRRYQRHLGERVIMPLALVG